MEMLPPHEQAFRIAHTSGSMPAAARMDSQQQSSKPQPLMQLNQRFSQYPSATAEPQTAKVRVTVVSEGLPLEQGQVTEGGLPAPGQRPQLRVPAATWSGEPEHLGLDSRLGSLYAAESKQRSTQTRPDSKTAAGTDTKVRERHQGRQGKKLADTPHTTVEVIGIAANAQASNVIKEVLSALEGDVFINFLIISRGGSHPQSTKHAIMNISHRSQDLALAASAASRLVQHMNKRGAGNFAASLSSPQLRAQLYQTQGLEQLARLYGDICVYRSNPPELQQPFRIKDATPFFFGLDQCPHSKAVLSLLNRTQSSSGAGAALQPTQAGSSQQTGTGHTGAHSKEASTAVALRGARGGQAVPADKASPNLDVKSRANGAALKRKSDSVAALEPASSASKMHSLPDVKAFHQQTKKPQQMPSKQLQDDHPAGSAAKKLKADVGKSGQRQLSQQQIKQPAAAVKGVVQEAASRPGSGERRRGGQKIAWAAGTTAKNSDGSDPLSKTLAQSIEDSKSQKEAKKPSPPGAKKAPPDAKGLSHRSQDLVIRLTKVNHRVDGSEGEAAASATEALSPIGGRSALKSMVHPTDSEMTQAPYEDPQPSSSSPTRPSATPSLIGTRPENGTILTEQSRLDAQLSGPLQSQKPLTGRKRLLQDEEEAAGTTAKATSEAFSRQKLSRAIPAEDPRPELPTSVPKPRAAFRLRSMHPESDRALPEAGATPTRSKASPARSKTGMAMVGAQPDTAGVRPKLPAGPISPKAQLSLPQDHPNGPLKSAPACEENDQASSRACHPSHPPSSSNGDAVRNTVPGPRAASQRPADQSRMAVSAQQSAQDRQASDALAAMQADLEAQEAKVRVLKAEAELKSLRARIRAMESQQRAHSTSPAPQSASPGAQTTSADRHGCNGAATPEPGLATVRHGQPEAQGSPTGNARRLAERAAASPGAAFAHGAMSMRQGADLSQQRFKHPGSRGELQAAGAPSRSASRAPVHDEVDQTGAASATAAITKDAPNATEPGHLADDLLSSLGGMQRITAAADGVGGLLSEQQLGTDSREASHAAGVALASMKPAANGHDPCPTDGNPDSIPLELHQEEDSRSNPGVGNLDQTHTASAQADHSHVESEGALPLDCVTSSDVTGPHEHSSFKNVAPADQAASLNCSNTMSIAGLEAPANAMMSSGQAGTAMDLQPPADVSSGSQGMPNPAHQVAEPAVLTLDKAAVEALAEGVKASEAAAPSMEAGDAAMVMVDDVDMRQAEPDMDGGEAATEAPGAANEAEWVIDAGDFNDTGPARADSMDSQGDVDIGS